MLEELIKKSEAGVLPQERFVSPLSMPVRKSQSVENVDDLIA